MPSFFFHLAIDLHNYHKALPRLSLLGSDIFHVASRSSAKAKELPVKDQEESVTIAGRATTHKHPATSASGPILKESHLEVPSSSWGAQNRSPFDTAGAQNLSYDWRYGNIALRCYDMQAATTRDGEKGVGQGSGSHVSNGIEAGSSGLATKGRYEPIDPEEEDLGWGIVRLYRDVEETPGLYEDTLARNSKYGRLASKRSGIGNEPPFRDEDCTTLCILAVPSYLTPSDFLGFVGEKTRDAVSHFRMIRTDRVNRYMVLMKFRNGKKAREWRKEWNGKAFNSMEPENCHVVFVKSIEFRALDTAGQEPSFPDMTNDPFTPSASKTDIPGATSTNSQPSTIPSSSLSTKPMAPPTPALVELPTCPVCLERMDESTGLLTILCQHVFHCSCLQKWRGSGCPVCRYTQDDFGRRSHGITEDVGLNECTVCRSDANLWICLICGNVGCGRYDAAHAFLHYQQSSHCFAMDLTTQRVWDYASDGYVHRIVQNKTDGKLVELPSAIGDAFETDGIIDDFVPREKLESIGMEYTHLLTSQLDSQRMYFEEKVERAADKASQANLAAEKAASDASLALQQLTSLQLAHDTLSKETIPALERDKDRATRRAEKFETMARKLEKEWREEKAMSTSLMQKVESMTAETQELKDSKRDLEDQNRDLSFFISGQEKLKDAGEEIQEGTVSIPDPPAPNKRKGGNKGKR